MDFHEQNIPKSVVLRMDKKEYKNIFVAVKTHTGKEVEFLGDAKDKSKKERNERNTTNESSGCTESRAGANRFPFGCDNAVHGEPYDENETRGSGGDQTAWRNDEARRI